MADTGVCECCEIPYCPNDVTLEWQTISNSETKPETCGFEDFNSNGAYYLLKTKTTTGSIHASNGGETCICEEDASYNHYEISGYILDPICAEIEPGEFGPGSHECGGTDTVTYTLSECDEADGTNILTGTWNADCSVTYVNSNPEGPSACPSLCIVTETDEWVIDSDTQRHQITTYSKESAEDPCDNLNEGVETSGSVTVTEVLSEEFEAETTAELITRTENNLPEWPEDWLGAGGSFRDLSVDETTYSIIRSKYRIKHRPTGTCYLKVWLKKTTTPESGSPTIVTSTYTWNGMGNPCITNDSLAIDNEVNLIYSDSEDLNEPASDGEITLEIVKYSCDPNYTPPDDGSANGFNP